MIKIRLPEKILDWKVFLRHASRHKGKTYSIFVLFGILNLKSKRKLTKNSTKCHSRNRELFRMVFT